MTKRIWSNRKFNVFVIVLERVHIKDIIVLCLGKYFNSQFFRNYHPKRVEVVLIFDIITFYMFFQCHLTLYYFGINISFTGQPFFQCLFKSILILILIANLQKKSLLEAFRLGVVYVWRSPIRRWWTHGTARPPALPSCLLVLTGRSPFFLRIIFIW